MAISQQARKTLIDKLVNASASKGGQFITDGDYVMEIEKVVFDETFKGSCFIVELKVLESSGPTAAKVGSHLSWVQNITKHLSALGNAKAFVLALFGVQEDEVPKDELDATMVEVTNTDPNAKRTDGSLIGANPAKGKRIRASAYPAQTRAGQTITLVRWSHYEEPAGQ